MSKSSRLILGLRAVKRVEELTEIPRYRNAKNNLTKMIKLIRCRNPFLFHKKWSRDRSQPSPPPQEGKDPTPSPEGTEGPPEGE